MRLDPDITEIIRTRKGKRKNKPLACKEGRGYYHFRYLKQNIKVHHCVVGCPLAGYVVDHIDGDKSNNTRENLRVVPKHFNDLHRHKSKGYTILPSGRYRPQLMVGGKQINLKICDSAEEAREIHKKAKILIMENVYGEYQ